MTQERRKAEIRSTEELVFTDEKLIAAGLAHLEAEKAAACLVRAKGDLWVGVGTKAALRGLLSEDTASQSQAVPSELASQDVPHAWKWNEGAPPAPFDSEWFLAITTYGDRVCLKPLPETYSYDYKTADDTYIMRDRIKCWAQFPDSEYVEFASHSAATGKAAPAVLDLPSAIMDIPCEPVAAWGAIGVNYYRLGHRDARHAAADLVLKRADELAALASPAAPLAGKAEQEDYWKIAHLIGNIFFAGDFKAETYNERELEALLIKTGHRYRNWEEVERAAPLAAAVPAEEARCTTCDGTGMVHRADGEYLGECDCETPAEPAPIQASAPVLSKEEIDALAEGYDLYSIQDGGRINQGDFLSLIRDVEREVLARLSKPTAQGTVSKLEFTAELDNLLGKWAAAAESGVTSHEIIRDKIIYHIATATSGQVTGEPASIDTPQGDAHGQ